MIERIGTTRLLLESKLDSLSEINPWLDLFWHHYNLPDDRRFDISLCLYEAIANIVMYGYEQPHGHHILVVVNLCGDVITITIEDDGRPFNPLDHPETTLPSSIEEAAIGGHGISLIRSLSDKLQYERWPRGNKLTITNCIVQSRSTNNDTVAST